MGYIILNVLYELLTIKLSKVNYNLIILRQTEEKIKLLNEMNKIEKIFNILFENGMSVGISTFDEYEYITNKDIKTVINLLLYDNPSENLVSQVKVYDGINNDIEIGWFNLNCKDLAYPLGYATENLKSIFYKIFE